MPRPLATIAAVLVLAAGCSQEEPVRGTAVAPATAAADIPAPVEAVDGNEYWTVYLAVGPETIVSESLRWLEERNLPGRVGPLGCDEGAEAVVGEQRGPERVAAFFERVDDANVFAMALPDAPAGIGLVTPNC